MSDPHPEAGFFRSQTTQNSGQEVGPYIKRKKNIVGLITVEKIDLANTVCKFSTFVKSLLVAPWSLTLPGLTLAGAISKPHHYKQKYKIEGPPENMGFKGKTV